jgi:hypothetical protein
VRAIGRLGWAYASTKERPAPPKTDPSRSGRGGRSPGAAGEGAFGLNVVASPTGPAAAHRSPITRRTDRTEPIEHRPTPDPAFSLPSLLPIPRPPYPGLPPRRLDGRPTGLTTHTNPRITPAPAPLPPPRPRPTSTRLGKPPHICLARRGRGASATRWPPFLESPGGKRKTGQGGAAARSRLRRTPRNEQQETNTKRRTGSRPPRYRVHAEGAARQPVGSIRRAASGCMRNGTLEVARSARYSRRSRTSPREGADGGDGAPTW